jgi:DNA-binding response OmpR family regulator
LGANSAIPSNLIPVPERSGTERNAVLVLIVEDEPVAAMLYMAVLARTTQVTAVAASTVAEARSRIAVDPPELVILDMQLPDGSGLDVVATLEAQRVNAVLIVVTAFLNDEQAVCSTSERIHVLGKPVSVQTLRQLIGKTLAKRPPASPLSPVDCAQLACLGQHSAVIECLSPCGHGEIVIQQGQLWSARDEQGAGVEALHRLALAKGSPVRVLPAPKEPGPRNLASYSLASVPYRADNFGSS